MGLNLQLILIKKNTEEEYWPRLTNLKHQNVTVDWSKYIDEDEEGEQDVNKGLGDDWDPNQMNSIKNNFHIYSLKSIFEI